MSVTRINQFIAAEGKGSALRDALRSLVHVIESADGCLSCQLLQSRQEATHLILIEVWENEEIHRLSLEDIPAGVFDAARALLAVPPNGDYYDYCPV
jgi:quinol monooxygenase YgiN